MKNNHFYAFDNANHLVGSILSIVHDDKTTSFNLSEFLLNDFPRKTILNIEYVNTLSESSISYKINAGMPKIIKKIAINKDAVVRLKTSLSEEEIKFNFNSEHIELTVFSFLDTPMIAQHVQDNAKQSKAKQSKAKQSKAKQSKAKQSKAEFNK